MRHVEYQQLFFTYFLHLSITPFPSLCGCERENIYTNYYGHLTLLPRMKQEAQQQAFIFICKLIHYALYIAGRMAEMKE